jgi:hypothetical protein
MAGPGLKGWRRGVGGDLKDQSRPGIDADSIVAEQVAAHQESLDEIFARLQGDVESLVTGVAALSALPGKQEVVVESQKKGEEKTMSIDMDEIVPGLDVSRQREIAREILKNLPQPSVTDMQAEFTRLNDANLDPKIKEQRDAERQREAAAAPPIAPDVSNMNEAQRKIALEKHAADKETYMQGLLDRKTGLPYSKSESRALAHEILQSLRNDGSIRI